MLSLIKRANILIIWIGIKLIIKAAVAIATDCSHKCSRSWGEMPLTVVVTVVELWIIIPVVVKFVIGVDVPSGYKQNLIFWKFEFMKTNRTHVVMKCVVGGVVVVVVVLETTGSQILNTQKLGSKFSKMFIPIDSWNLYRKSDKIPAHKKHFLMQHHFQIEHNKTHLASNSHSVQQTKQSVHCRLHLLKNHNQFAKQVSTDLIDQRFEYKFHFDLDDKLRP